MVSDDTFTLKRWIDVTVTIRSGLVNWPGDPLATIEHVSSMDKGAANNSSRIDIGSHTGTHADAPRHFFRDGRTMSSMPLDQMIGTARVIDICHEKYITREELVQHNIHRGERILFKTRNSASSWDKEKFNEDFVSISRTAAEFLAQRGLKVVGVDYLSVGGYRDDGIYIHRTLLGAGIWLIEGLDLSKVEAGRYYLICLPLKLETGDGAPARAILRRI